MSKEKSSTPPPGSPRAEKAAEAALVDAREQLGRDEYPGAFRTAQAGVSQSSNPATVFGLFEVSCLAMCGSGHFEPALDVLGSAAIVAEKWPDAVEPERMDRLRARVRNLAQINEWANRLPTMPSRGGDEYTLLPPILEESIQAVLSLDSSEAEAGAQLLRRALTSGLSGTLVMSAVLGGDAGEFSGRYRPAAAARMWFAVKVAAESVASLCRAGDHAGAEALATFASKQAEHIYGGAFANPVGEAWSNDLQSFSRATLANVLRLRGALLDAREEWERAYGQYKSERDDERRTFKAAARQPFTMLPGEAWEVPDCFGHRVGVLDLGSAMYRAIGNTAKAVKLLEAANEKDHQLGAYIDHANNTLPDLCGGIARLVSSASDIEERIAKRTLRMGIIWGQEGDTRAAVRYFDECLEDAEGGRLRAIAYYNKADVLSKAGQTAESREALALAVEHLDPLDSQGPARVAWVEARLMGAEGRAIEAAEAMRAARLKLQAAGSLADSTVAALEEGALLLDWFARTGDGSCLDRAESLASEVLPFFALADLGSPTMAAVLMLQQAARGRQALGQAVRSAAYRLRRRGNVG